MAQLIRFRWSNKGACRWFVWEARKGICNAKISTDAPKIRLDNRAMYVRIHTHGLDCRLTTEFPDGDQCTGMPPDSLRSQREQAIRRDDAIRAEAYAAGQDVGDFVTEVFDVFGSPHDCEIRTLEAGT